jgi:ketosteroid isomerase-like protein
MSEENVEAVRSIFAAWGRGELNVGADRLDEHVVFVVRPEFPAFGACLGPQAIEAFMRDFVAQWEWTTFEAERIRPVGDTIIVDVVQRGKGRASGVEAELRFFMLFTFRGRKVVRYETVMHEHEALEAVGLSE